MYFLEGHVWNRLALKIEEESLRHLADWRGINDDFLRKYAARCVYLPPKKKKKMGKKNRKPLNPQTDSK